MGRLKQLMVRKTSADWIQWVEMGRIGIKVTYEHAKSIKDPNGCFVVVLGRLFDIAGILVSGYTPTWDDDKFVTHIFSFLYDVDRHYPIIGVSFRTLFWTGPPLDLLQYPTLPWQNLPTKKGRYIQDGLALRPTIVGLQLLTLLFSFSVLNSRPNSTSCQQPRSKHNC